MHKPLQLPLFQNEVMIHDILILINPPAEVSDYVYLLKKEIAADFGDYESRTSKAHVTVNNFLISENRLQPVFAKIKDHLSKFESFNLKLNGFSIFNSSHTLFINVEQTGAFKNLIQEFEELRLQVIKTKKYTHSKKPHLTIAKNLNTQAFKKLKKRFLTVPFEFEFEVNSLTVLKYNLKEKKYDHFCDISFRN